MYASGNFTWKCILQWSLIFSLLIRQGYISVMSVGLFGFWGVYDLLIHKLVFHEFIDREVFFRAFIYSFIKG